MRQHAVRRLLQLVFVPAVLLAALIPLSAMTAASDEPPTVTSALPVDLTVWVTCSVEPGELVHLTGSLMAVARQTTSDSGVVSTYVKYNPANVTGVGTVSGATFRGTGVSLASVIERPAGETTIVTVENFRLLTAGPGNNVTIHLNLQLTIAPDGSITARVENATATCR